jgi:hypothetical protein
LVDNSLTKVTRVARVRLADDELLVVRHDEVIERGFQLRLFTTPFFTLAPPQVPPLPRHPTPSALPVSCAHYEATETTQNLSHGDLLTSYITYITDTPDFRRTHRLVPPMPHVRWQTARGHTLGLQHPEGMRPPIRFVFSFSRCLPTFTTGPSGSRYRA